MSPCHVRRSQWKPLLVLCQLHKLQDLVRDAKMSAKFSVYSLESRCSSSVFFSIRPSGEIRSWVESPSTLDSGIIAILALLPLRRLHVYCILCPLARPKSEPTRPRSGLIAVSRRSRAQRELQRALPRRRHRDRPTPWDRPTCCVDAWSAVCRGQPSLLWWELNVCLVYSYAWWWLRTFKGTRLQVKSKTANTIVLDSIVFGFQIRWSRGKK